jgi:hypothetical protein
MPGGFWRNAIAIAVIAWFSPVHSDTAAERMSAAKSASGAWLEQAAANAGAELTRQAVRATGTAAAQPVITAAARRELERLAALAARAD